MQTNSFLSRHIGPRDNDMQEMLSQIGVKNIDELIDQTLPANIRLPKPLNLAKPMTEFEYSQYIGQLAAKNKIFKSFIGMGYYGTITPAVILRNIFENPGWYNQLPPYQAVISQGRLEALLNFQTMVISLTGSGNCNCSLLDEATAAAEAMIMMYNKRDRNLVKNGANVLLVDEHIFTQPTSIDYRADRWE
jgi:glycine dehydrogenase